MHIEDEQGGMVGVDQTSQDEASEERLTCPGSAKNAGRTLYKAIQVQANRMLLLAGVTDDEVAFLTGFAKDFGNVALARQSRFRMVGRDCFYRQGAGLVPQAGIDGFLPARVSWRRRVWTALQHQSWQHFQVGVERLP